MPTPCQAERWRPFAQSIFSQIARSASKHGAVSLAQGFPDLPGPHALIESMRDALQNCPNQYSPGSGQPELKELLAQKLVSRFPDADPNTLTEAQCLVTAGATEAVFCLIMGLVNPGERVLCLEPYYEPYRQAVAAAGGEFVTVKLQPPEFRDQDSDGSHWSVDWEDFEAAASLPFKVLLLNTPHNPTGMAVGHGAMEKMLKAARRWQAILVSDEVYEELVYDGQAHVSPLEIAQPADKVVRVSSVAKSYGFTGFKLGWIQGHAEVVEAAAKAHEAILFCVPMHLQLGFSSYLRQTDLEQDYLLRQRQTYRESRVTLENGLLAAGFELGKSVAGTYFVTASAKKLARSGESDSDFAERLMATQRVAALPLSSLCLPRKDTGRPHPALSQVWLRFSFCKSAPVIAQALANLALGRRD